MTLFATIEPEASAARDGDTQSFDLQFFVPGKAQPAGSKKSLVPINKRTGQPFRDKRGRVVVSTKDANDKAPEWKGVVSFYARQAMGPRPLFDGPLEAHFTFIRVRTNNHYRTGRHAGKLRPDAPAFPATKPDLLKVARAVEDAMSGVVYVDDNLIVREVLEKAWGVQPGVYVSIRKLPRLQREVEG